MTDVAYVAPTTLGERPAPPELKRKWTRLRVIGAVLLGLWITAGLALLIYVVSGYRPELYERHFWKVVNGIWVTLALVSASVLVGGALAYPIAFGRMSKSPLWSSITYGYVQFFRGTPLLAQVFIIFYGIGQFSGTLQTLGLWWFFEKPYLCAFLAFTLNTAAYQAEILRGAITSIPKGQTEAAQTLGLRPGITFFKIIMPQALVIALRPLGNEIILMIKGSAIASIITVYDLMGETRLAFSRSYDFQVYLWAAVLYLSMVETLRRVWNVLERRLTRHLVRTNAASESDTSNPLDEQAMAADTITEKRDA